MDEWHMDMDMRGNSADEKCLRIIHGLWNVKSKDKSR
jgi:hypothetical protein